MASTAEASEVLEERPLRELVVQLSSDATLLAQQELALAKREVSEKLDELKISVVATAAGVLVLQVGFLCLAAALVLLLARSLPDWAAAMAVGAAFVIVGGVMFGGGQRHAQKITLKPEKTVESVKKDVEAIKEAAQ